MTELIKFISGQPITGNNLMKKQIVAASVITAFEQSDPATTAPQCARFSL
jgi:hypothetical protein